MVLFPGLKSKFFRFDEGRCEKASDWFRVWRKLGFFRRATDKISFYKVDETSNFRFQVRPLFSGKSPPKHARVDLAPNCLPQHPSDEDVPGKKTDVPENKNCLSHQVYKMKFFRHAFEKTQPMSDLNKGWPRFVFDVLGLRLLFGAYINCPDQNFSDPNNLRPSHFQGRPFFRVRPHPTQAC